MDKTTRQYWVEWLISKRNPLPLEEFESFVESMEQNIGENLEGGEATDTEIEDWKKLILSTDHNDSIGFQ